MRLEDRLQRADTARFLAGKGMSVAREVVDELLNKMRTSEPSRRRVVRPTVTRDDVEKLYIHRARPVVHRVRRVQRIVPVVQPLYDDGEQSVELPTVTRQRVVPVQRRAEVHEWTDDAASAMRRAEQQVAEIAAGRVSATHIEAEAVPEEVHELTVHETVEEVLPVRKRTIKQPTIVEQVQPVYEAVTETAGVDEVEWRDALPRSQWRDQQDDDDGGLDQQVADGDDTNELT